MHCPYQNKYILEEEITKKRSQSRLLFFLMATDYNPKYLRMS